MIPSSIPGRHKLTWLEEREEHIPRDMIDALDSELRQHWGEYYITSFETGLHSFILIVDANHDCNMMSGITFMKKKYTHLGSTNIRGTTFDDIRINEYLTLHLRSSNHKFDKIVVNEDVILHVRSSEQYGIRKKPWNLGCGMWMNK